MLLLLEQRDFAFFLEAFNWDAPKLLLKTTDLNLEILGRTQSGSVDLWFAGVIDLLWLV